MNVHLPHDLPQMQSLPLEAKITMSKRRIRAWYEHWDGMVYVSFSGGKDSTVLLHLVRLLYPDTPAVFVNTGLELPEIQRFARSQPNVTTLRPAMSFVDVIKTYGYPVISKAVSNTVSGAKNSIEKGVYSLRLCQLGVERTEYGGLYDDGSYDYEKSTQNSKFQKKKYRYLLDADFDISDKCCSVMKKQPTANYEMETGRHPFIATLASESLEREVAWIKNGCNAFNTKRPKSTPLAFWTEQDILHYIKKYHLPYCSVYGDIVPYDPSEQDDGQITTFDILDDYEGTMLKTTGCDRTGCMFCMFGCHLEKDENRFQKMKKTHPRQYDFCIHGGEMQDGRWKPNKKGLGCGHVLDYIGVPYE